jgi:tryptophan 2,3-dioxygenase
MELSENAKKLLEKIEAKYKMEDQEFEGYLEGLLYNQYLDYWDYINLDALLSLQIPRTNVPDEMIFIMYHQLTELNFKLALIEYQQIAVEKGSDIPMLIERIRRINTYFYNLTRSFEIMRDGMQYEQFMKFRLSLLPASGFQSVQYRMIEIASTDLLNLVDRGHRDEVRNGSLEEQYKYIYWKYGATDIATGKKTLTLRRFEEKYADKLINWAYSHKANNLWQIYKSLPEETQNDPKLLEGMRELDLNVNVRWPLVHVKTAARYLLKGQDHGVAATGGTNWQKYLPPKVQRRVFFPELFQEEELEGWGSTFR